MTAPVKRFLWAAGAVVNILNASNPDRHGWKAVIDALVAAFCLYQMSAGDRQRKPLWPEPHAGGEE